MAGGGPSRHRRGAIIGLIALYAVLLQAFLTVSAPGAVLREAGILCLDHEAGHPADGLPAHRDHACCTLAHGAPAVPPNPVEAVAVPTPARVTAVVWRPEAAIPRTGPPTHATSARGPPLA
jgi:hypothetical protein